MKRAALACLLSGCVIPSLDESGRACPCSDGYVCAANVCVTADGGAEVVDLASRDLASSDRTSSALDGGALDAATSDAATGDVVVGGETIHLPPGWTARLLVDFSSDYTYSATSYTDSDGTTIYSNQPLQLVALVAPFTDGIAVLAGRTVLELPSGEAAKIHDYTPSSPDSTFLPDEPRDLFFSVKGGSMSAGLLVASSSVNGGDGIFEIDQTWAMQRILVSDNDTSVTFDAQGAFGDDNGNATVYYAQVNDNDSRVIRPSDGRAVVDASQPAVDDIEITSPTSMSLVIDRSASDTSQTLAVATYAPTTNAYTVAPVAGFFSSRITLVTGALSRLPAKVRAVTSDGMLVEATPSAGVTILAQSLTPGWSWQGAAIPPASHSLGATPVYLVLESNRMMNRDRILVLTPP